MLLTGGSKQQPAAPAPPVAQLPAPAQLIPPPVQTPPIPAQRTTLGVVVLDPAHGGTDPGARGGGGTRESDLVMGLAALLKLALERQGFSVLQTRQGNDDPSLDDRSAMANAQRGAVFLTLHVGSTGLPGSVRVYSLPDFPPAPAPAGGLLPWDRAQATFLPLSRKLADLTQAELARGFKGSPANAQTAPVRQLRTIALPAIAIEVSSVTVEDRAELQRLWPGIADAVARGVTSFKPVYESGSQGTQP